MPATSTVAEPADLAGRPTAGHGLSWMVREYQAAVAHHGLEPGPVVDADDGAYAARSLERGEADVTPAWVDTIPSIQQSGEAVFRAVPVAVDVYATGLLAADRVSAELVERVTAAVADGVALQRTDPEPGMALYHRTYPKASLDYLRTAWAMFEPNAPTVDGDPMAAARWVASVAFYADAFELPAFDLEQVCRPEWVTPSGSSPPAGAPAAGAGAG